MLTTPQKHTYKYKHSVNGSIYSYPILVCSETNSSSMKNGKRERDVNRRENLKKTTHKRRAGDGTMEREKESLCWTRSRSWVLKSDKHWRKVIEKFGLVCSTSKQIFKLSFRELFKTTYYFFFLLRFGLFSFPMQAYDLGLVLCACYVWYIALRDAI